MSSAKPSMSGLVTSDGVTAGARLRRRVFWVSCAMAVLIVLVGISVLLIRLQPWQAKAPAKAAGQLSSRPTTPRLTPSQQLAAAQKRLQDAQTSSEKAAAYQQLGAAYLANGQSAEAIGSYSQASDATGESDTTATVAILFGESDVYYYSGDKAKQIAVLQQIIALLKNSSDPYAESKIEYATMTINALEGNER